MRRRLILGGPGAGKTTRLLRIMEETLARGVPPAEVAFVSFTNAAVDEAATRATERFKLSRKEMPYFRTVHSFAFRELGLRPGDVLTEEVLAELAELTGELQSSEDEVVGPGRNADTLLTIDHYARATGRSLEDAWRDHGGDVDWFRLKRFSDAYRIFREDRGLLDFTDMLTQYAASGARPARVRVAIVDEAQDLTRLQRAVIAKGFADAEELYIAGDDDQGIHQWAGADLEGFMAFDGEREVLPLSHRLPQAVFDLSREVIGRVSRRYDKETRCGTRDGSVDWVADPAEVDLSSGSWLMLARTRAQLVELAECARSQGVVYSVKGLSSVPAYDVRAIVAHERLRAGRDAEPEEARLALRAAGSRVVVPDGAPVTAASLGYDASTIWHDALVRIPLGAREYYLSCLRRGERLQDPPRVRVDTIHGSKGSEAEGVVLVTDMTQRTWRGYELNPDSEARVFYVGATRASERLTLVAGRGASAYPV